MSYLIRTSKEKQRGFTIIELLLVIAITGAIGGVIAQTIMMMWDVVTDSRSHVAAIMQVQNAERWIERDAKMAQTVDVERTDIFVTGTLTMTWSDWDGAHTEVRYNLEGNYLMRRELLFSPNAYDAILQQWTSPDITNTTFIARDVVPGSPQTAFHRFDMTSNDENKHMICFNMTVENQASIRGSNIETRSFLVKPRSIW